MAVTLNASTSSGLVSTADTSGTIELQSNGTTIATVSSTGLTASSTSKAWVRFAGASGTIAGSYNVSSVTRGSTGFYTINFTNALANANYSAIANLSTTSGAGFALPFMFTNASLAATAPTTSSFLLSSANTGAVYVDPVYASVAVFSS
jgi:hypothetical protein